MDQTLVAPAFAKKVAAAEGRVRSDVAQFLTWLQTISRPDLIKRSALLTRAAVGADETSAIYAFRQSERTRVIFTFANDNSGEYVLLVDLIVYSVEGSGPQIFAAKNPVYDGTVNPQLNGAINPNFNGQLNPNFNGSINPNFNGAINPRFNGSINPAFNGSINYKFNSSINPAFNSSINPLFNSNINPNFNALFGGPFIYELPTTRRGYLVKANENVGLIFSMKGLFEAIAVKTDHGYVVFDKDNNWSEHWVADSQGGFLRFDLNNQWIGFVV
jgi:hypothetical protein